MGKRGDSFRRRKDCTKGKEMEQLKWNLLTTCIPRFQRGRHGESVRNTKEEYLLP